MNQLKFTIYENSKSISCTQLSEPELIAIKKQVNSLLPSPMGTYWYEVNMTPFIWDGDEEEPDYGVIGCYKENPIPININTNEWERKRKLPHPLPKDLLQRLEGQTFRIPPRLTKKDSIVEILFETRSHPASRTGIKASDLITKALLLQKCTKKV